MITKHSDFHIRQVNKLHVHKTTLAKEMSEKRKKDIEEEKMFPSIQTMTLGKSAIYYMPTRQL